MRFNASLFVSRVVLLLVSCWVLLCLYLVFKLYERSHFIDVLPAAIEPAGVVLISGQSGFREGCGVAVFRLDVGLSCDPNASGHACRLLAIEEMRDQVHVVYH